MTRRNLSEWLAWQESLNPAEIDLGLERIRSVAGQLALQPPPGGVVTVAGTNGRGSTAAVIEALLRAGGKRTGLYSSPHLVCYNERIRLSSIPVEDAELIDAFEQIEHVRGATPLTFFEYGTLAALLIFSRHDCDAWILEVGLGGRLDAVNLIDPDVAVITTIALDHQEWLGDTVEEIAREKAGIIRPGKPVLYGDQSVPAVIHQQAEAVAAELHMFGTDFSFTLRGDTWNWSGQHTELEQLPLPAGAQQAQLRNQALALAAVECKAPEVLADVEQVRQVLAGCSLPGRCQSYQDDHQWLLDVAHNPQAAAELRSSLLAQGEQPTVFIMGMLGDKDVVAFCAELDQFSTCWIACPTATQRGAEAAELAAKLENNVSGSVCVADSVMDAMAVARARLPVGGRIVVCGSFQIVGPALEQLGLY
jgi:dihydrofolate synthase/folylpolyglutamate synthase